MGLLSFIKDVGEKLFGASEAQAASVDELKKELDKHGLNADGLDIKANVTASFSDAKTLKLRGSVMGIGETVYWKKL